MLVELQAHKRHHGDDRDAKVVVVEGGDAKVDIVRAIVDGR